MTLISPVAGHVEKLLCFNALNQGWWTFSVKSQMVNITGCEGHAVFITMTQLCQQECNKAWSNLACGLRSLISGLAPGTLYFPAKSPFSSACILQKRVAKKKNKNTVASIQPTFRVKHFTGVNYISFHSYNPLS